MDERKMEIPNGYREEHFVANGEGVPVLVEATVQTLIEVQAPFSEPWDVRALLREQHKPWVRATWLRMPLAPCPRMHGQEAA